MRILIISKYGHAFFKDTDFIPRLGDKIDLSDYRRNEQDLFSYGRATVNDILLWPPKATLEDLTDSVDDISALVVVE